MSATDLSITDTEATPALKREASKARAARSPGGAKEKFTVLPTSSAVAVQLTALSSAVLTAEMFSRSVRSMRPLSSASSKTSLPWKVLLVSAEPSEAVVTFAV